jgi:copper chaperone CopZ
MSCSHCQAAVEGKRRDVAGVEAVQIDLSSKLVTVHGDALSDEQLRDAIKDAGYEAD